MKINVGKNDICYTCKYKNPLISTMAGCQLTDKDCPAEYSDVFLDDTRNLSDCKCYKAKRKEKKSVNPVISEIVEYLNQKTGKQFQATTRTTIESINGRLREKYTVDDFKKVIDIKVSEWNDSPKMNKYLNPETLFRPGNFEKYLNQKEIEPKDKLQSKPSYNMEEIKRRAMENTEI